MRREGGEQQHVPGLVVRASPPAPRSLHHLHEAGVPARPAFDVGRLGDRDVAAEAVGVAAGEDRQGTVGEWDVA